jgi:hypothetical protein
VLAWGPSRIRRRPAASRVMWLRLRGLLLVTLIAVAAAGVWLGLDDRFYIQRADVTGAVRVSAGEVFRASGLPGLHILWARPSEIEKRILEALPTLESVRVKCTLPARCGISVIERQPKVIWEENGVVWWIDADGMIFQPPMVLTSAAGDTMGEAQRWVVRGPLPRNEKDHLNDRVCVGLSELWATGADVALEYEYVPGRGLMFTDERGWPVFLGQGPGMAERLSVLERLTADLEMGGLTPLFVDVRFPDTPYYSLTNNWWD